jgi:hypothetical protein
LAAPLPEERFLAVVTRLLSGLYEQTGGSGEGIPDGQLS